jgi:hypothetical protein
MRPLSRIRSAFSVAGAPETGCPNVDAIPAEAAHDRKSRRVGLVLMVRLSDTFEKETSLDVLAA